MSVLATRKPRLLFRFVGSFLLRFAERRFCGVLFPPPVFDRRLSDTRAGSARPIRWPPRLTRLEQGACQGEIILPTRCSADSPSRPSDIVGRSKKIAGASPQALATRQQKRARSREPQMVPGRNQRVLATRKPRMSPRIEGTFVRRSAERRFCGASPQEPPR